MARRLVRSDRLHRSRHAGHEGHQSPCHLHGQGRPTDGRSDGHGRSPESGRRVEHVRQQPQLCDDADRRGDRSDDREERRPVPRGRDHHSRELASPIRPPTSRRRSDRSIRRARSPKRSASRCRRSCRSARRRRSTRSACPTRSSASTRTGRCGWTRASMRARWMHPPCKASTAGVPRARRSAICCCRKRRMAEPRFRSSTSVARWSPMRGGAGRGAAAPAASTSRRCSSRRWRWRGWCRQIIRSAACAAARMRSPYSSRFEVGTPNEYKVELVGARAAARRRRHRLSARRRRRFRTGPAARSGSRQGRRAG